MKIRLDKIKNELLQIDRDLGEDEVPSLPGGIRLASPSRIRLKVSMAQDTVACRGRISGKFELTCSRCLCRFVESFSSSVDVFFSPDISADEKDLLEREPGLHSLDADADEIDLGEDLREILLVCIPQKPLCKEDCKGLCPQCGAELNEGPCECEPGAIDLRWEALAKLKAKLTTD